MIKVQLSKETLIMERNGCSEEPWVKDRLVKCLFMNQHEEYLVTYYVGYLPVKKQFQHSLEFQNKSLGVVVVVVRGRLIRISCISVKCWNRQISIPCFLSLLVVLKKADSLYKHKPFVSSP